MVSNNWQSKPHRTRVEISADILRLLRLGKAGKTEISSYANLTWDQGTKYTENLVDSGLIETAEREMGLPCYRITKKGLKALSLIENLKEMLPPDGGVDILHKSKISEINAGQILVSKGVADLAKKDREFATYIETILKRYCRGDWGDKGDDVSDLKTISLERNMRLFSAYESDIFPEIWITTSPDRAYTTIMFPEEDVSLEAFDRYWAKADAQEAK
jgi:predicted transcriptional regulator